MPVSEIMQTNVQYAHRGTKADVLAALMIEGFGAVPIVDDTRHLLGIVSEYDLLTALENGRALGELTAGELMTPFVSSVTPEADVATVIGILQTKYHVRMPVVDDAGRLLGIVARRDILRRYLNAGMAR